MFICVRFSRLCSAALGLWLLAGISLLVPWAGNAAPAFSSHDGTPVTVIVDAGHGGEDGGALSPSGVKESDINLAVAQQTESLLRFCGVPTEMTRREDVSIHDPEAVTIRQKKTSDLQNRVELVNSRENALLLSIHQNSLPSSAVTWGAQAFWNEQEGGETLAAAVQETLNQCINTHRAKEARSIASGVYLMKHIQAPGVLVECGFLSNAEETARLQQPEHQRKIACAIVAGLLRGMAGEES